MLLKEAPEKIFISYKTNENGCIYPDYMWHMQQFEGMENIEYTCSDAFIDEAVRYLNSKQYDCIRIEHPNTSVSPELILNKILLKILKTI